MQSCQSRPTGKVPIWGTKCYLALRPAVPYVSPAVAFYRFSGGLWADIEAGSITFRDVAVNDFMANGGDHYGTPPLNPQVNTYDLMRDLAMDWVKANFPFAPPIRPSSNTSQPWARPHPDHKRTGEEGRLALLAL